MTMSAVYEDLRDQHVLISGGSGGIGAGLTRAFAAQGSRVSVMDRDEEAGRQIAAELGGAMRCYPVELTDEAAVVSTVGQIIEDSGDVGVLINNAGTDPRMTVESMSLADWEGMFQKNVGHYFLLCREILPSMRRAGGGSVIMTSSVQHWLGMDGLACYTATKSAIVGFVKALAGEWGRDGIRVNGVAPGWVMTERQQREMITPEVKNSLLKEWQCIDEAITPERLAEVYLFLASDASAVVTRQVILADAGWAKG
jgi:NAD(P)-dependent dehydrogenase (short-subunit alcohol dehydrogenase family)